MLQPRARNKSIQLEKIEANRTRSVLSCLKRTFAYYDCLLSLRYFREGSCVQQQHPTARPYGKSGCSTQLKKKKKTPPIARWLSQLQLTSLVDDGL